MKNLLYLFGLLVLTGCVCFAGPVRKLNEAQQLLSRNPKAVLAQLNGMDISLFRNFADMVRWAFLYSEAMVVTDVPVHSDTIINIAIDYYAANGRRDEWLRERSVRQAFVSAPTGDALWQALYRQKAACAAVLIQSTVWNVAI